LANTDKRYFIGLPSPSAAAVMAGLVWFSTDLGLSGAQMLWPALIVTISAGALMFSNILYFSFKKLDMHGRVPFIAVLIIVLIFVFTSIDPPKVLFIGFLLYGLSGPVLFLWRRWRRNAHPAAGGNTVMVSVRCRALIGFSGLHPASLVYFQKISPALWPGSATTAFGPPEQLA
jgi:hypothetical protein